MMKNEKGEIQRMRGILFVLSGPSGTGKGTICKELIKRECDLNISVSATTRECRVGETPGVTYNYVSVDTFKRMIDDGEMLEHAIYNGNYYGTPKRNVEKMLEQGTNVLLEIEPQGALNVKKLMPEAVLIFVIPPSMQVLKERLVTRGRETDEEIIERLNAARWELSQADKYAVNIVNNDLDDCVDEVIAYFNKKREEKKMIENLIKEEV